MGEVLSQGMQKSISPFQITTEPSSVGLNVALDSICQKTDPSTESNNSLPENGDIQGIPEAVPSPYCRQLH